MQIKTFRAKTMPQALDLVRSELGPAATVLHAREVSAGLLSRMLLGRRYEIAATLDDRVGAPSAAPQVSPVAAAYASQRATAPRMAPRMAPLPETSDPSRLDAAVTYAPRDPSLPSSQLAELEEMVQQLRSRSLPPQPAPQTTEPLAPTTSLFDLFAELVEREVDEDLARELIESLAGPERDFDAPGDRAALGRRIAERFAATGPIRLPTGETRIVALVGPTGVGKTTTIAKLAANFRLREGRRVGLITVDTYRIAAVEQLRTYADIIDLPLEVVGTPREMREAAARLQGCDLVLIDTAGRSPRDEVQIRELRSLLAEARPDEVHLVLSAASSARSLAAAVDQFAPAGLTHVVVTKLDEVGAPGNLLKLPQPKSPPMSYFPHGQHVPDDIAPADAETLGAMIAAAYE